MKLAKRIGGFFLALALILTMLPAAAAAEESKEIFASGAWGDNLTWELDADGLLTVKGIGEMADNPADRSWDLTSWHRYRDRVNAVVMEEGITSIGAEAFLLCNKIKTVVIPEGVTAIGDRAFACCSALEEMTIPSSIASTGEEVFEDCPNLKRFVISEGENQFLFDMEQLAIYSKDKTVLYLVMDQAGRDLVIPEGVVAIADDAFSLCFNVGKLVLPSTLKEIGALGQTSFVQQLSGIEVSSENPYFCSVDGKLLLTKDGTELVLAASLDTVVEIPASVKKVRQGALCGQYKFCSDAPVFEPGAFKSSYQGKYREMTYYPADTEGWHAVKEQFAEEGGKFADASPDWTAYDLNPVGQGKDTIPMYRLYTEVTGEHFYTGSLAERDNLMEIGWKYEGIAWNAPVKSGEPVYRLYNPNANDHHYTMSAQERDDLIDAGWQYEGVAWNSAPTDGIPLYRLYNPNAESGSHHYTGSAQERDDLKEVGWRYEGIAWFSTVK